MRPRKHCAICCERGKPRKETCCEHDIDSVSLRHGWQRPENLKSAWTNAHLEWIKTKVHFDQPAQEIALTDYVHQVEHLAARIERLDQAVLEAARSAPPQMRAVIETLQALRGIAQVTTVTIVAELGQLSRFAKARQLMGYAVWFPVKSPAANENGGAPSPRPATRT